MLASVIALHGDDSGLVLPYTLSPVQVVVIPVGNVDAKVGKLVAEIRAGLIREYVDVEVDDSDKRVGEKFYYWEMKGVPFRVEVGPKEIESGEVVVFIRDSREKVSVKVGDLAESIKNLGAEYDERLIAKVDGDFAGRVVDCSSKGDVKKALGNGKVARFGFCSCDKGGAKCAEFIEKELQARVMGTRGDVSEKAKGKCLICGVKAKCVVYAGKSY